MYFIQLTPKERESGLVAISRSNIRTFCPMCGSVVPVDLQDFVGDEGFRLIGSSVLCSNCTQLELQNRMMKRLTDVLSTDPDDLFMEEKENE